MDVLVLDGKNYVKSSVIARELGYTTDYVGQLCRTNKVDAKLFGRTWYVEKSSITGHKTTRYRSTQATSKKALKVHLAMQDDDSSGDSQSTALRSNFYTYGTQKAVPRYIPDQAELMPTLGDLHAKRGTLEVDLADATEVKVHDSSPSFSFKTPKLPEIHFKGKLKVTNYEDTPTEVADEEQEKDMPGQVHIHPKVVEDFKIKKSKKTPINKDSSAKPFLEKIELISEQHIAPVPKQPHLKTPIQRNVSVINTETSTFSYWILLSSLLIALLFALLMIGSEVRLEMSDGILSTSYIFEIKNLQIFFLHFFGNR